MQKFLLVLLIEKQRLGIGEWGLGKCAQGLGIGDCLIDDKA